MGSMLLYLCLCLAVRASVRVSGLSLYYMISSFMFSSRVCLLPVYGTTRMDGNALHPCQPFVV